MRKKIYLAIVARLKAAKLGVAYFNLWNNNVGILAKERGYKLPAVFVEFEPVEWHQLQNRARSGELRVRLHIVTATLGTPEDGGKYQDKALAHFDLIDRINAVLPGLSGDGFNSFMLVGSETDHDHEQILHHIEVYVTRVTDTAACKAPTVAAGATVRLNTPK